MDELHVRLQALEMVLAERLALEPIPMLAHIEDNIRGVQDPDAADPVRDAALAFLARVRGGFDPYSAGYGITSPDEQAAIAGRGAPA